MAARPISVSRSLVSAFTLLALGMQLGPVEPRGHHARGHAAVDQRRQRQRAAIVEDAHRVAVGDAARLGVVRVHFQLLRGARFHLAVAVEIGKGRVHVVVGLAAQELQRIALRILAPARFRGRDKSRKRDRGPARPASRSKTRSCPKAWAASPTCRAETVRSRAGDERRAECGPRCFRSSSVMCSMLRIGRVAVGADRQRLRGSSAPACRGSTLR